MPALLPQNAKLHRNFSISPTSYDIVYFQTLFNKDTTMLETLEESMEVNGYGPLLSTKLYVCEGQLWYALFIYRT